MGHSLVSIDHRRRAEVIIIEGVIIGKAGSASCVNALVPASRSAQDRVSCPTVQSKPPRLRRWSRSAEGPGIMNFEHLP
jgi:hypothetical protein